MLEIPSEVNKAVVSHPGAHGGHFYFDEHGKLRYGTPQSKKRGSSSGKKPQVKKINPEEHDHEEVKIDEEGIPEVVRSKHTSKALVDAGIEVYLVPEANMWQLTKSLEADSNLIMKAWYGVNSAVAKSLFGDKVDTLRTRLTWFAKKNGLTLPSASLLSTESNNE